MGSWDDMRFVLAVARAESVRKAARELGVNHSTVSRRVSAYEERLGVRMFERVGSRLVLTTAGAEVLAAAERVEGEIIEVERRVAGGDLRLEGSVRVALPSSLLSIFAPVFAEFAQAYPELDLEFVTGLDLVSLSHRDADVALRIVGKLPADLFGKRVGYLKARAFALPELAARYRDRPLSQWPWVSWTERFGFFASARWLREEVGCTYTGRFESGRDIEDGIRGGLGAGFMLHPSPPGLVQVPGTPENQVPLWLVTHSDLRNVARIRAVLTGVGDGVRRQLKAYEQGSVAPGS